MLHNINLIPWREAQREAHKRRFVGLCVLVLMVALGVQWGAGFYLDQQTQAQQQRLAFLNQHIRQLDAQIAELKVTEQEHKALL
ncbi:MAG: pilus assembly protein PilN, partial [Vibrio fluvialis]